MIGPLIGWAAANNPTVICVRSFGPPFGPVLSLGCLATRCFTRDGEDRGECTMIPVMSQYLFFFQGGREALR